MADSAARSSGADITLVHGGVGPVADAVMLARATRRILRQNLGWAFGCNLLLVTLAAAGILPPVLAAVAMATNSVTVVGNGLGLRRFGKASGTGVGHPATAWPRPRRSRPPGYELADEPGRRRAGRARAGCLTGKKSRCRCGPRMDLVS
jgi:hypothetical protein